jgi:cytoskeletal protein CcmA (bactofilin family)
MIKGEVLAQTVHIHGSVNGHVKARDVNLAKTAHVIGNILHENMSIETGAFLEGNCKSIEANEEVELKNFESKNPKIQLNENKEKINKYDENKKAEVSESNEKRKTPVL